MATFRAVARVVFYLAVVPVELLVIVALLEWWARRKQALAASR
ncbi:MAG TPA: hypothetical protein VKU02_24075 [Gemmataceae bacterium]|nr:hypothetical protein [Gemmataceae bacterium]